MYSTARKFFGHRYLVHSDYSSILEFVLGQTHQQPGQLGVSTLFRIKSVFSSFPLTHTVPYEQAKLLNWGVQFVANQSPFHENHLTDFQRCSSAPPFFLSSVVSVDESPTLRDPVLLADQHTYSPREMTSFVD